MRIRLLLGIVSQLGMDVMGVDLSSAMLHLALVNARLHGVRLRTLRGSFEDLGDLIMERFSAVFVMGSSLSHLLSKVELENALRNFASVLEPYGLLAIQILNYERIMARRKAILNEWQVGNSNLIRSYDHDQGGLSFNIVT
jgi:SAM-dependent methyltransferase